MQLTGAHVLDGSADDQTGWIQFGEVLPVADRSIIDGTATSIIIVYAGCRYRTERQLQSSNRRLAIRRISSLRNSCHILKERIHQCQRDFAFIPAID